MTCYSGNARFVRCRLIRRAPASLASTLLALLSLTSTIALAAGVDEDSSVSAVVFDATGLTTGVAPFRTVLQFNINDSGASDGLPTIVNQIRFTAEVAESAIFLGNDFAWKLRVPTDKPGEYREINAPPAPATSTFAITFEDQDGLFKLEDGSSAAIQLLAQFTGAANGQVPDIPSSTSSNGVFLTADVKQDDILVEASGSSRFTPSDVPTLTGHVRVNRPSFRWVVEPVSTAQVGDRVEAIGEVVDPDGVRLTAITENVPAVTELYASGWVYKEIGVTDGPIAGLYYFTADAPLAGGGTADRRLDLDNSDGYPVGPLRIRAGVLGRVDVKIQDFSIGGDVDSSLSQVGQLDSVDIGSGYTSAWFVRLTDAGTTDNLPTILHQITIGVAIGDGCLFNALDAAWRLNVGGDTFEPTSVTADRVTFASSTYLTASWPFFHVVPANFSRDMTGLDPLLFAPDGGSEVFELQMDFQDPNIALDGLPLTFSVSPEDAISKILRVEVTQASGTPTGSLVGTGLGAESNPPSELNIVANATFPADACNTGEGEGEGEGSTAAPHTADLNGDHVVNLSELLRVIQFYNSTGYGCEAGTEDGFAPNDADQNCPPHASDYNPQNWAISLSELLRVIQFYNTGAYHACVEGEDGFCPGA